MTDFVRIPGKIFAENASPVGNNPEIGKFGNAKQGIYTGEADVQEIQNSDAWSQGWTSAVVSAMNFPPLPEMNGVLKVLSYQICYLLQKGIPEWNADTIYYKNDYVNYNGKLYYSSIDNNTYEPETPGAGNSWLSGTSDVAIATNYTNGISRPDDKTVYVDEDGTLHSPKWDLFDIVQKDHILTFEEKEGLELLGEYVYKEAQDGRYGYPDFYAKCLEEYTVSEPMAVPFEQPILTQNGTMGEDTFAVEASSECVSTARKAYMSFDGKTNTKWGTNVANTGWLTFYNPVALKVKSITYNASSDYPAEDGGDIKIYGSNDNSSWDILYTGDYLGASNASLVFDVNSEKYYKYHKIEITNGRTAYIGLGNLTIDALEETFIKIYSNGHKFYDIKDKDKIDEIYENQGIAWYYGIDEKNERILLPRNKYFFQAADISEVGSSIEAGLPNIEGNTGMNFGGNWSPSGAFHAIAESDGRYGGTSAPTSRVVFDASYSNPIYGNSDTVQPPAVKILMYMVVGNTAALKSQISITEMTSSENDTIPMFFGQYFDFKPNHASWIKAGTSADGKLYVSAYNKLLKISKGQETKYGEEFKVIEENKKQPDKDYIEYWIVNEEEMTFKAPLKTSLLNTIQNARILIEKKEATEEDKSWYNLYSDGWLEQGNWGKPLNSAQGENFVRLLKPYKDKNYEVFASSTADHTYANAYVSSEREIVCETRGHDFSQQPCYVSWTAKGYAQKPNVEDVAKSQNTSLYFKVANALENLELIDAGQVFEELNNKIGKTECKSYIIDSYTNETSGYRVYSDGYCEQWTSKDWGDTGSFTFLKPYNNANWILVFNSLKSDTNSNLGIVSKSNTGFEYNNALTTLSGDMYVVGYLKEGTY